eukprot:SAG31_NODE_4046_length_3639_cov_19.403390_4_plen_560_part_00
MTELFTSNDNSTQARTYANNPKSASCASTRCLHPTANFCCCLYICLTHATRTHIHQREVQEAERLVWIGGIPIEILDGGEGAVPPEFWKIEGAAGQLKGPRQPENDGQPTDKAREPRLQSDASSTRRPRTAPARRAAPADRSKQQPNGELRYKDQYLALYRHNELRKDEDLKVERLVPVYCVVNSAKGEMFAALWKQLALNGWRVRRCRRPRLRSEKGENRSDGCSPLGLYWSADTPYMEEEYYIRPGHWGPGEKNTAKLGVDYFDSPTLLIKFLRRAPTAMRFDASLGKGALAQQLFHVVADAPLRHGRTQAKAPEPGAHKATQAVETFEREAEQVVRGLFLDIGGVAAVTVRIKAGHRKSWALVTFQDPDRAAKAAANGPIEVQLPPSAREGGGYVKLKVRPATVRGHLRSAGFAGGALGSVSTTHAVKAKLARAAQASAPANPNAKIRFQHAVRLAVQMRRAADAFQAGAAAAAREVPLGPVARGRLSVRPNDVAFRSGDPEGKGWVRPPDTMIESSRHRCMIAGPDRRLPRRTIHQTPKALGLTGPEQQTFIRTF